MEAHSQGRKPTTIGLSLLGLLLLSSAGLHLGLLGQDFTPAWDETIHAAVAGNLAKHPWRPTLIDQPVLDVRPEDWQANHIWLHKPPLPFWQVALSVKIFGRSFFAFRFFSLLFHLASLALIYWLGCRWSGEAGGLLAAAWMAVSPLGFMLTQGAHFGDITDVSLTFWLLATMAAAERCMVRRSWGWAVFSGLCQAAAWLSKSALALPTAGAVLAAWIVERWQRREKTVTLRLVLCLWLIPLFAGGSWALYSRLKWPEEAAIEARTLWQHVISSFEGHGKSWDALWNELTANLAGEPLVLWLVAGFLSLVTALGKNGTAGRRVLFFWLAGTIGPLHLVSTKVPALLWGAAPAFFLAGAHFFLSALERPRPVGLALALTPAVFLLAEKPLAAIAWGKLASVAPNMAALPLLPQQLVVFLVLALVLWPLWHFSSGVRLMHPAGRLAGGLGLTVGSLWLVWQTGLTRDAFSTYRGYNPASHLARKSRSFHPPRAAIFEGSTDGRQRPEYVFSFLTGVSAQLLESYQIETAARLGRLQGVWLITALERNAQALVEPVPGQNFYIYRLEGELPQVVDAESAGEGPVLEWLELERERARTASPLWGLARWRGGGQLRGCSTQAWWKNEQGARFGAWVEGQKIPRGIAGAEILKQAPPGWWWGMRAVGSNLYNNLKFPLGARLVDGFYLWVPRHLAPGRYRLELELHCPGRNPFTPQAQSGKYFLLVEE